MLNENEMTRLLDSGFQLTEAGRLEEALQAWLQALAHDPARAAAHRGLAHTLRAAGLHRESAESAKTAWLMDPARLDDLARCVLARLTACDWAELEHDLAELKRGLAAADAHPVDPFLLLMLGLDGETLRAAAARHAARVAAQAGTLPPCGERKPGRWRIGYLSADFHAHATMLLWIEALEQHDREHFDVTLYCHSPDDGSALRTRTRAAAAVVELQGLSDEAAARRIRADGIDVLVDLKGYTQRARPGILAWRPAPLQINYLGHPGTLGSAVHDYLIGDAVLTPFEHQALYSEAIAQLPGSYQPNDSQRPLPPAPPRAALGLPEDALVLASFNQAYKLRPEVFAVWLELLRDIPGAVLWLLDDNAQAREALQAQAEAAGLEAARLVFAPRLRSAEHLARLQQADLALDTFPVNGHTTTSDALWAGVPVLTLRGGHLAERVSASLLHAAGLPQLVTDSLAAYRSTALALLQEPARLRALKQQLVRTRATLPMWQGARYARDFSALLQRLLARHAQGLPPDFHPAAEP